MCHTFVVLIEKTGRAEAKVTNKGKGKDKRERRGLVQNRKGRRKGWVTERS